MSETPRVQVEGIKKSYGAAHVLRGIDLIIHAGELAALYGPSGSGKTTLLNLIGALDLPTSGTITIDGDEITQMSDRCRVIYRRRRVGFIFQNYTLLPTYSAAENIDLTLRLQKIGYFERRRRVRAALQAVGLSAWSNHLPGELSGGQRQRIAIARALTLEPALILADEPTSGLDTQLARRILDLFRVFAAQKGTAFLIVSHDPATAERVDTTYDLRDGRIIRRAAITRFQPTPEAL